MSRLIDAEQAKLMLSELLEVAEKENFTAEDAINHAYEWVDNIPTAYSVEKVVGEIEDVLWNCYIDNGQGFKTYVNRACEILKRGGIE